MVDVISVVAGDFLITTTDKHKVVIWVQTDITNRESYARASIPDYDRGLLQAASRKFPLRELVKLF